MKCLNCGIELEQKGNRKKEFCDDKCRMAYKRSNPNIESEQIQSEHPEIQSEQSNPNIDKNQEIESMSFADRIGKYIEGYCHGCGRKNTSIPENWVDKKGSESAGKLICICLPCVRKGITHESLNMDIKKCS